MVLLEIMKLCKWARKCNLHLVSKLRYDSALFLPFAGKYKGRGARKKYGKKLDCHKIAKK